MKIIPSHLWQIQTAKPFKLVSLRATIMDIRFTYQLDSVHSAVESETDSIQLLIQETDTSGIDADSFRTDSAAVLKTTTLHAAETPRPQLPAHEKTPLNTDWLAIVIFIVLGIFATIRYAYVNYIKHLFTSLLNYPTSVRLLLESNYPAEHAAYRLDAVFYIGFAVFIFQTFNVFNIEVANNGFLFFLFVLAGVLLYFFGKKVIYTVVGSLFETKAETTEYLFNMSNFNRSLGIVLIPLLALISFSPFENPKTIVFTGLLIVLAFQLVLIQRGAIILLRKQFSILYLFLYLCTLEFLPLLLIYKVVVVE